MLNGGCDSSGCHLINTGRSFLPNGLPLSENGPSSSSMLEFILFVSGYSSIFRTGGANLLIAPDAFADDIVEEHCAYIITKVL